MAEREFLGRRLNRGKLKGELDSWLNCGVRKLWGPRVGQPLYPASVGTRVHSASQRETSRRLQFFPEKKSSGKRLGALRVPVCTLFARVPVSVKVHVFLRACACKCARVCLHVCLCLHVLWERARVSKCTCVCGSASMSVYECVCMCARAICEEGIPTQNRAAGACFYSSSVDPHS